MSEAVVLVIMASRYIKEAQKSLEAWKEADARMCETERKIAIMKLSHYEKTGEML